MHPKLLFLLIIIPTTTGFVDCRSACRTCRELKAEQTLLEVNCAMCEECKQRRRERMQMKGQQTMKKQNIVREASSQLKPQPTIQYLQPQYPEGCPTPAPCPHSQEEFPPGLIHINLDGQTQPTCPPVEQCATNRVQYINSVVSTPQPPIQQAPSTPQYNPPPIPIPAPLPPPLPLPLPMPPMPPFQYQSMPATFGTTTREAPIVNLLPSSSPHLPLSHFPPLSPPSVVPPLPPALPIPGPLVPPPPPPMPYPPYYPGCYCLPYIGPGCHCGSLHHRPVSGVTAHDMFPFTTERETISTKEYFYAYVGVPRDILKD